MISSGHPDKIVADKNRFIALPVSVTTEKKKINMMILGTPLDLTGYWSNHEVDNLIFTISFFFNISILISRLFHENWLKASFLSSVLYGMLLIV